MTDTFDILGLGCATVDELLYVDAYPAADSKRAVRRWERQCGGLTATALVAGARLGARCAYAGALGEDELSRFVLQCLRQEGIDVRLVRRQADARPIHSVVVVDESRHTRTIFFDLAGTVEPTEDWPAEEAIRSARVLFLDHYGVPGIIRAARLARAAGIPVVADLESADSPRFDELLALVDHLILSRSFAERITGRTSPDAAVRHLWASTPRRSAVVTCGGEGCWYIAADAPGAVRHQPAFAVDVVDTTGCGDVFHGAYAAATARGRDVATALRFASAAAALKAARRGGQAGIPTLAAVEAFLESP
jgi:sugar/nucleoside kinase (ribokinase family)